MFTIMTSKHFLRLTALALTFGARQAMGIAVFADMIGATPLRLVSDPGGYVALMKLGLEKETRARAAARGRE